MKDFDHPNVMKLIGVCLDSSDGFPYIILEYMENGSIKDFLKCNRVHENDIETIPKVRIIIPFNVKVSIAFVVHRTCQKKF